MGEQKFTAWERNHRCKKRSRKNKKNVKKRKKRGKNKKTFKTLNKSVGHNVFNFLPNA